MSNKSPYFCNLENPPESPTVCIGIQGDIRAEKYNAFASSDGRPGNISMAHMGDILEADETLEVATITEAGNDEPVDYDAIFRQSQHDFDENNDRSDDLRNPSEENIALKLQYLQGGPGEKMKQNFVEEMIQKSKYGSVSSPGCSLVRTGNVHRRFILHQGPQGTADGGCTYSDHVKSSKFYFQRGPSDDMDDRRNGQQNRDSEIAQDVDDDEDDEYCEDFEAQDENNAQVRRGSSIPLDLPILSIIFFILALLLSRLYTLYFS